MAHAKKEHQPLVRGLGITLPLFPVLEKLFAQHLAILEISGRLLVNIDNG